MVNTLPYPVSSVPEVKTNQEHGGGAVCKNPDHRSLQLKANIQLPLFRCCLYFRHSISTGIHDMTNTAAQNNTTGQGNTSLAATIFQTIVTNKRNVPYPAITTGNRLGFKIPPNIPLLLPSWLMSLPSPAVAAPAECSRQYASDVRSSNLGIPTRGSVAHSPFSAPLGEQLTAPRLRPIRGTLHAMWRVR